MDDNDTMQFCDHTHSFLVFLILNKAMMINEMLLKTIFRGDLKCAFYINCIDFSRFFVFLPAGWARSFRQVLGCKVISTRNRPRQSARLVFDGENAGGSGCELPCFWGKRIEKMNQNPCDEGG